MALTTYLYFVKDPGIERLFKIGVAQDLKSRMSQLQNGNGRRLSYLKTFKIQSKKVYQCERALHLKFDAYRAVGEWFIFDDETLVSALEYAQELESKNGAQVNDDEALNIWDNKFKPRPRQKFGSGHKMRGYDPTYWDPSWPQGFWSSKTGKFDWFDSFINYIKRNNMKMPPKYPDLTQQEMDESRQRSKKIRPK